MKNIRRKVCIFFICVFLLTYYLLPKIVITSPKENILSFGYVINYKNGYTQNGEPTVKQMEAYIHGVKIYSIFNNRDCIIFPILCAKEISSISIGGNIYNEPANLPRNESELKKMIQAGSVVVIKESKKPITINTKNLYFFRIYADFSNDANFENVYIKKYPWSKKKLLRSEQQKQGHK